MGKIRRGGFLIYYWVGDHEPKHVHVLKDGRLVAKVRVRDLSALSGKIDRKLKKILEKLKKEKKI